MNNMSKLDVDPLTLLINKKKLCTLLNSPPTFFTDFNHACFHRIFTILRTRMVCKLSMQDPCI